MNHIEGTFSRCAHCGIPNVYKLSSSALFKICVEKTLNIWKRKCSGMGCNVDNAKIYKLQLAGDQVVMAQSKEGVYVPEAPRRIF